MATISPQPKLQFFDGNGVPLAGGKLYTYAAGTTTPLTTYTDSTGTASNTNPVILDSRGEASVWLGDLAYKFRLKTATDVDIWTVDNLTGVGSAAAASRKVETFTATAGQTVFNLTTMTYTPTANNLQVFVDGLLMVPTVDYAETSSTRVTFTLGLLAGNQVLFRAETS